MSPRIKAGAAAIAAATTLLVGVPNLSSGASRCELDAGTTQAIDCARELTGPVTEVPVSAGPASRKPAVTAARQSPASTRQTADPTTTPPLHGTSPHGQGTVAVVDTNPSTTVPYSDDPTGKPDGEDVVVGRSRGEQREDGSYRGHVTVAALFGNEILGVDTGPGETKPGPFDAVQTSFLDALCDGSGDQICLRAVTADSSTSNSGSTNSFGVARATIGGANGIDAGVAESNGNISSDGACQTSSGDSQVADVKAGGSAVASVAKSSSQSKACRGQAPTQSNSSSVIALGGSGVPLPAPGCANGTPDTVTGVPTVLPIVCNADDSNGAQAGAPYGVREALDVFLLATGNAAAAKVMTAGAESRAVAPTAPEQCADGIDNDGDGLIDAADPQCHTDGNAGNPDSYNPGGTSEAGGSPQCSDATDNDGDGLVDAADPGCHSDGDASNPASYRPNDDDESNGGANGGNGGEGGTKGGSAESERQCSDGADNDGDGLVDAADPGCHSDGDASNPASYRPNDDSELDAGVAGVTRSQPFSGGSLPFTGSDVVSLAFGAALLLAGGLALRRRVA